MTQEIYAPKGVMYLNDIMEDLPHNCVFDKRTGNVGGTTIALENNQPYIIAVPYVSLIQNKLPSYPNVLGVYKQTKDNKIKQYMIDPKIPIKKIIVTYDSLPRLFPYITKSEFRILIDEMHLLFQSYSFRYKSVQNVLQCFREFKSYCFMTATIAEREFMLDELKDIPIVKVNWFNLREVTVEATKCHKSVIPTVMETIRAFLDGRIEGNAYFFVNSVEFIKNIINLCGLDESNTSAIWSIYNKTDMPIKRGDTTSTDYKKINFLTSSCFEGCDLKDPNGKTYIISEGKQSTTLLDISTSISQISFRLRNSIYWDRIYQIYTTTRYDIDLTFDSYRDYINQEIVKDKQIVAALNTIPVEARNKFKEDMFNGAFISVRDDTFIVDENLVKLDLFNFKTTKYIYKIACNLSKELENNRFKVEEKKSDIKGVIEIDEKETFKETVEECKKGNKDYLQWAFRKYPYLQDAIELLGYEGIEKTNYHITNIQKAINRKKPYTNLQAIKEDLKLHPKITKGVWISNEDLKNILKHSFEDLGFNGSAKAKDIEKIFVVKEKTKRIKKKVTAGYTIINLN